MSEGITELLNLSLDILTLLASILIFYFLIKKLNLYKKRSTFFNLLSNKTFKSRSIYEINKLPLIRIIFAIILLQESYQVYAYLIPSEIFGQQGLVLLVSFICSILLITGLLQQYVLLFLTFFMWHIGDSVLRTSTLGHDITAMLAIFLFLTHSGRIFSLDGLLIRYKPNLSKFLLYFSSGYNQTNLAISKFLALFSYSCLCYYSIIMHINDDAWLYGYAAPQLLSSTYLSQFPEFFQNLFINSEFSVVISKISMWVMMFWYPMILPFVIFGGIFKRFIVIWGFLFFCVSAFVLQLGYLAYYEFLFWIAIFWTISGISNDEKIMVAYDDRCNLCDKTIQVITFCDIFGRIELKPASENVTYLNGWNISLEEAMEDLYGIQEEKNKITYGYEFYFLLSKKIILFWPLAPIFFLGKLFNIGPSIYKFIAKRRRELFGECTLIRKKYINKTIVREDHVPSFNLSVMLSILILGSMFVLNVSLNKDQNNDGHISRLAHLYGISAIDVFNKTDLGMSEIWFTLEDEQGNIIPLFSESGERLEMHNSARVYFGHTLYMKRRFLEKESCMANTFEDWINYFIRIDLNLKNANSGQYLYVFKQFKQPNASNELLIDNIFQVQDRTLTCQKEINFMF